MKWNLSAVAKWLTVGGGSVSVAAKSGAFGRWSAAVESIGLAMIAVGAAVASQTSAGHPNGAV